MWFQAINGDIVYWPGEGKTGAVVVPEGTVDSVDLFWALALGRTDSLTLTPIRSPAGSAGGSDTACWVGGRGGRGGGRDGTGESAGASEGVCDMEDDHGP